MESDIAHQKLTDNERPEPTHKLLDTDKLIQMEVEIDFQLDSLTRDEAHQIELHAELLVQFVAALVHTKDRALCNQAGFTFTTRIHEVSTTEARQPF